MRLNEFKLHLDKISTKLGIKVPPCSGTLPGIPAAILNTQCLLVKADNLTALQWLLSDSQKTVDFCYIDPPYNTGSSFVYNDKRQSDRGGIWGRHHDWLSFMLPRLAATFFLLKDNGVIAVSIDDYEYAYLKILMDAIFGERNFISTLIVARSNNGKGGKANVAVNHEYILIYGKTTNASLRGLIEENPERYNKEDEHGKYTIDGLFRKKGEASRREDRPNMFFPLYYDETGNVFTSRIHNTLKEALPIDSKGIERRWLWGLDKTSNESWKLYASPKGVIYLKTYASHEKRVKIRSILQKKEYLNDRATRDAKEIFGERVFETPKPISLIKDLIDCCSEQDATVLDFFAGTGTTAEACRILNIEQGARRKCILVEHEHTIDLLHAASNKGFTLTSDITEYRLRKMHEIDPGFHYEIYKLTEKNNQDN